MVSIIIPVYNVSQYLSQLLDSLVNQTLQDIEIIAVNDASTDGSLQILYDYRQRYPEKIQVINLEVNSKPGGARNAGLAVAKGEYVAFVDSDDWVDTSMYEKLYSKALETNACVVDCDYYHAYTPPRKYTRIISNKPFQIGVLNDEIKKSLIIDGGRIVTKIIKRELLTSNGFRYPENTLYEDNAMQFIYCFADKLEKVDEALYYYRQGNYSITRTKENPATFDRLTTAKLMVENFKTRDIYEKYKEAVDARFSFLYYIYTIGNILLMFRKFQLSRLNEIRLYMKENMPNYRENQYFRREVSLSLKVLSKFCDIHPLLLYPAFLLIKILRILKLMR